MPSQIVLPLERERSVEPDNPRFGVMQGERLAESGIEGEWRCFDVEADPSELDTVEPAFLRGSDPGW